MSEATRQGTSRTDLLALPLIVSLETAGRPYGFARSTCYDLVKRGLFPVPVRRVGRRYKVLRSDLLADLGIADSDTKQPA